MIADDERKVCLLIQSLIHWEQLGLELVGTADNGLDALELIRREKPDIVITDIRMPRMDGLEMIAAARDFNSRVRFIVISGYKQFEYAHSALRYGVEDYLLKPISELELNNTLRAVADKLDNAQRKNIQELQSELDAQRSRSFVQRHLLERLLQEETLDRTSINSECGLAFDEEGYQAMAVQLDATSYQERESRQDRLVLDWISKRVRQELQLLVTEQLCGRRGTQTLFWLFNYHCSQSDAVQQVLDNLILPLKEYVNSFGCYEITVGIGKAACGFLKASGSLLQTQQCLDSRILLGTGRRIDYRTLMLPENGVLDQSSCIATDLEHAATNLDSVFYCSKVTQLLKKLYGQKQASALYSTARGIVTRLYSLLPGENQHELAEEQARLLETISGCSSYEQLVGLLCSIPADRIEIVRMMGLEAQTRPVRIAKRYIEQHYADKISLEDLSGQVNLSPVYFSAAFKKETGETLSDYITSYRIEMAKQLLRTTNDTIVSVADQVGYKDAKYFSKLFAKVVGVNPAQYRKLYS